MKNNEVKKIEEEIKLKTTLPDDIKGKIRKEIFVNIVIAAALVVYFTFLILGSVGTIKNVRSMDFNIFSIIILSVSIYLFEISYRKDNGKLAMFGIEALVTAIFTLFLPYIIFELDEMHKKYYLMIGGYIAVYYIIKCIYISFKIKKEHMKELSDIKDIVKKEKYILYKNTDDATEKLEKTEEKTSDNEKADKQENDKKKTKQNKTTTKKNVKIKVKSEVEKVVNEEDKNAKLKDKEKTNESNKNAPKKRGRPKKEDTLKKEIDVKTESAPKKRGRPRKVVTSND